MSEEPGYGLLADVVTSRFEMPPEWKGNPPSASLDPAPAPMPPDPGAATVMCDERHPGFREGDPLGRPCVECLADVKTQEGLGCPGRDNDRRTLTLELPPWLVIDGPVHSVAVLTDRGWYWLPGSPEAVSAASQASTPTEAPDA